MDKEIFLWQFIERKLVHHQKVMLLLVTESSGSSPGRQGFKMAVAVDNDICGSIGGGIMEVKLVELAKKMLKESKSDTLIKKQIHSKKATHHQSGMICSGEQTVVYFLVADNQLNEVKKIIRVLGKYDSAVIRISHEESHSQFQVLKGNNKSKIIEFEKYSETEFVWKENIGYRHRLYIVGGGHCSLALSELMSKFEFYIQVMDDRPELNTLEQNSFAHEKHLLDGYEKIGRLIPSGDDVYVVVMTLGYRSDLLVLQKLMTKSFAYLGLLGSKSKIKTLKEELITNIHSHAMLKNLHAPVGLKIKSHTPEEIAVSIAAEIIKVKNSN